MRGKLNLSEDQIVSNENKYAENDDIKINLEKRKKSLNCQGVNTLKAFKISKL